MYTLVLRTKNSQKRGFTIMSVAETKKSNRAIQREHITYKEKAEISEALSLLKPYINNSTYEYLCYFLRTEGTGATQAKVTMICKKQGVSTGAYSKTVKKEIESTFSQPLIIKTKAPMKYCNKRKKRVKASEYKSLIPLSIIKHLVREKQFTEEHELNEYWSQFEPQSDIKGDIKGDIESNRSTPWESKDEEPFQQQHIKSFRENHLEKPIKDINNTSPTFVKDGQYKSAQREVAQVSEDLRMYIAFDKYFVKYSRETSDAWDNDPQRALEAMQEALNEVNADITNKVVQTLFKKAIGQFDHNYYGNKTGDQFFRLLKTCIVNELKDTPFKKSKTVVQGKPKRKPIRKEMLPHWLDEDGDVIEPEAKPEPSTEEREAFELEKQKLFNRIRNYKDQSAQNIPYELRNDFEGKYITQY